MAPQELILSSCSAAEAASSSSKSSFTPAIHLHDLTTSAHVQAFKTSNSAAQSVAFAPSADGLGGTVWAVQQGKAIVGIWAWQKDQQHLKLHLPERLTCLAISPNGLWVAGGSPNGQIYLWEIASGLMLASWNAHYRSIVSLSFTGDSALLLSASEDAAVHVFLVARLLDDESALPYGKPYGSLTDHTLGITAVALGKTAGSGGGRCWTAAQDGTVKMWSLHPPFDLLTTFSLPPGVTPTALAVDSSERFVYVGSTQGDVYLIPLFKRKAELGQTVGVGGEGPGAPAIKASGSCISVGAPVTCLALSISASHLLVGTRAGQIHIHALPSHQHLRTIDSHNGAITHLSTLARPPDLVGAAVRADDWPIMDIRTLERMRAAKSLRDSQEAAVLLRPSLATSRVDSLRSAAIQPLAPSLPAAAAAAARDMDGQADTAALHDEIKHLRAQLNRAIKINEKMWAGVVDMSFDAHRDAPQDA